ncbi:MAG: LysR family transcriptional regulator [Enhygromyxa sp.]
MADVKADLNQLVIFAKVVETQSFTAAGRELGLPKSTVSRKVAQLEERLGVVLLERTTRKLSLTNVGAAFFERCARISTEITEAEEAVTRVDREPRGLLRISAPAQLAPGLLADVVREFLLAHREIDLELELTERFVDLIEEGYDLSIRVGPVPDSRAIVRELGRLRRVWVASPEYLQRRGTPERPEELEHHDLLALGNPRRDPTLELGGSDGRGRGITVRPRLWVNSVEALRDAIAAGVGIGMLPSTCCVEELERRTLRSLLHEWSRSETISALYPTSRHLSAKVRRFSSDLMKRLEPPARLDSPSPITEATQASPQPNA